MKESLNKHHIDQDDDQWINPSRSDQKWRNSAQWVTSSRVDGDFRAALHSYPNSGENVIHVLSRVTVMSAFGLIILSELFVRQWERCWPDKNWVVYGRSWRAQRCWQVQLGRLFKLRSCFLPETVRVNLWYFAGLLQSEETAIFLPCRPQNRQIVELQCRLSHAHPLLNYVYEMSVRLLADKWQLCRM
jgi:hypothetical protein